MGSYIDSQIDSLSECGCNRDLFGENWSVHTQHLNRGRKHIHPVVSNEPHRVYAIRKLPSAGAHSNLHAGPTMWLSLVLLFNLDLDVAELNRIVWQYTNHISLCINWHYCRLHNFSKYDVDGWLVWLRYWDHLLLDSKKTLPSSTESVCGPIDYSNGHHF